MSLIHGSLSRHSSLIEVESSNLSGTLNRLSPLKASQLKKLIQEKDMEEQNGKQNKTKDNSRFEECNQTWNKIIFIKHCAHTKL